MGDLRRSLAVLARSLGRRPGYALTVIVTLAVGIGASTSIFSVLRGSVLRPLPYPQPERLVRVRNHYLPTGGSGGLSVPDFLDLQRQSRTAGELVAFNVGSVNLATAEAPERARSLTVTTNFFQGLGVHPALGRGFREGEDRSGSARVVVIADRLWRDRFGGRPDAIGQTLRINAEPYSIVGIMPSGFWFPGEPQVLMPYQWDQQAIAQSRGNRRLEAFARLAPGASRTALQAELQHVYTSLAETYPAPDKDWGIETFGVRDWMLGYDRTSLWLLSGAVLLVLLIGCVNVANLMLVRAERRQREIAVRAAIGAGRHHIVLDFLAESLLLATVASTLGVGIAWGATRVLLSLFGGALPRADQVALDGPVVAFAVGLALLTGLLVGLGPALRVDMRRVYEALREGSHGNAGTRSRLQRGLVAGEVALAVLLVAGAGLLLNSFWRLNHVETGINPQHALTFRVQLPEVAYGSTEQADQFFRQALERIQALPGVQAAGISDRVPLQGGYNITTLASPDDPDLQARFVEIRRVTPGFFQAAGIPLLQGRMLTAADAQSRADVVVISDELAHQIFPQGDAVGRSINPGWNDEGYQVVGVVGSVREFGVTQAKRPAFYWPYPVPNASLNMVFVVRTASGDALALVPSIRRVIHDLDPNLPIFAVRSMSDVVLETVGNRWFATALFAAFGGLALALSALGIFGVLAFAVEQRRREVGIRMALGATRRNVTGMVVRQGLRLVGLGLVVGIVAASFASRLLSSLLYQVKPADPLTLVTVTVVALATAAAASYLPARRAARIDPMRVVRDE